MQPYPAQTESIIYKIGYLNILLHYIDWEQFVNLACHTDVDVLMLVGKVKDRTIRLLPIEC